MRSFLRSFFASLLALVVVVLLVFAGVGAKSAKKPVIKNNSYLVMDIHGEVLPYYAPDGVMAEVLGGETETVHRILGNLEKGLRKLLCRRPQG